MQALHFQLLALRAAALAAWHRPIISLEIVRVDSAQPLCCAVEDAGGSADKGGLGRERACQPAGAATKFTNPNLLSGSLYMLTMAGWSGENLCPGPVVLIPVLIEESSLPARHCQCQALCHCTHLQRRLSAMEMKLKAAAGKAAAGVVFLLRPAIAMTHQVLMNLLMHCMQRRLLEWRTSSRR